MSEIIDASRVNLEKRKVLFDTNIWILVQGFGYQSAPHKTNIYSTAYKELIRRDNTIVVNDYIIGEFCNRCNKIEYDYLRDTADPSIQFPRYKVYRKSAEFRSILESIRDTCLNIIDDCEFIPVAGSHYKIEHMLEKFCTGELDFSDVIIASYCIHEDMYLMTDDQDFLDKGVKLITANRKLLLR